MVFDIAKEPMSFATLVGSLQAAGVEFSLEKIDEKSVSIIFDKSGREDQAPNATVSNLRTSSQVTDPNEQEAMAKAYNEEKKSYKEIEKQFGLKPCRGMNAYRVINKWRKANPERRRWTTHEWILCRELYAAFDGPYPPNRHFNHPRIMSVASTIGRTPQSVYLRLSNIGAADPKTKRRGFKHSQAQMYFEMPTKNREKYHDLLRQALEFYGVKHEDLYDQSLDKELFD